MRRRITGLPPSQGRHTLGRSLFATVDRTPLSSVNFRTYIELQAVHPNQSVHRAPKITDGRITTSKIV